MGMTELIYRDQFLLPLDSRTRQWRGIVGERQSSFVSGLVAGFAFGCCFTAALTVLTMMALRS